MHRDAGEWRHGGDTAPSAFSKEGQRGRRCFFITVSYRYNFMVYPDRLETILLQLFEYPENSEWFSIISVIIFKVDMLLNRSKHIVIGNDFFAFYNFPLLLTLLLQPLPYRCTGIPESARCVNKLGQNVGLQMWIWRHIMTSHTAYIQQWCTDMEILQSWSSPKFFHEVHIQSISENYKLWTPISNPNPKHAHSSVGLTIIADVAIATGPAVLGAPRSFVLNLFLLYARVDIRI